MVKFSLASRRNPAWYASDLRKDLGIDDATAVDLLNIIKMLDIHLKEAKLNPKILGACKVVGLKKFIAISSEIQDENQKRFTISHEIGHAIIHNGVHKCQVNDFKMWISTQTKEREANQFAAELLLPENIVLKELRVRDVSLDLAEELSRHYGISLISSVLRLVELCDEHTTLFYQKGDSIKWSFLSPDCKLTPRTGTVDIDSLSYHATNVRPQLKDYVEPALWFGGEDLGERFRCFEQSWYFKNLNVKLSVVRLEEQ